MWERCWWVLAMYISRCHFWQNEKESRCWQISSMGRRTNLLDGRRRTILELQRWFQRHEIRRNSEIQDSIATSAIICPRIIWLDSQKQAAMSQNYIVWVSEIPGLVSNLPGLSLRDTCLESQKYLFESQNYMVWASGVPGLCLRNTLSHCLSLRII